MLVFPVLVVYELVAVSGSILATSCFFFFVLAEYCFVIQFSETPIFGILSETLDPISKHKRSACEGAWWWCW